MVLKQKRNMAKIAFVALATFGLGGMQDYIKKFLKGHDINFFEEPLTEQNADKAAECEVIAFFIYSKVNDVLLKKLKKVRLVAIKENVRKQDLSLLRDGLRQGLSLAWKKDR